MWLEVRSRSLFLYQVGLEGRPELCQFPEVSSVVKITVSRMHSSTDSSKHLDKSHSSSKFAAAAWWNPGVSPLLLTVGGRGWEVQK